MDSEPESGRNHGWEARPENLGRDRLSDVGHWVLEPSDRLADKFSTKRFLALAPRQLLSVGR